jgi:hypothetical protein
MTEENIHEGHCPKCREYRKAEVVAHYKHSDSIEEHGVDFVTYHRILKCRGCETVYYQKAVSCSENISARVNPVTGEWEDYQYEDITHYPEPIKRERPKWAEWLEIENPQLSNLNLGDVYGALNCGLHVPAAIAARTTFDVASAALDIDPAITFEEKLDALAENGHIGPKDKQFLDVLTKAGNAAAHRGWRPTGTQLDTIISILENFLQSTFVLSTKADALKADIPKKPKRQKKSKAGTGSTS